MTKSLKTFTKFSMAQQVLDSSVAPQNFEMFSNMNIKDLKVGLIFPDENTAVDAVLGWCERACCPLMKARRDKGLAEPRGKKRGRRCLDCPHGKNRKGGAREV